MVCAASGVAYATPPARMWSSIAQLQGPPPWMTPVKSSGSAAAVARRMRALGDLRRAGHDELDVVLDGPRGVEEEDVLRAGAHVDREDAHGVSLR